MTKHAQKLRLLYLKDIFEHDSDAEHFLTCKQLIEKLELRGVIVERKTLYDDIACLKEYGMDIEKGSNKQGWRLVSRNFEDADLHFMADVVQSSKFLTKAKSLKLIEKISNLSSSFFGSNLKKQLYVENRIRNKNSASFYNLDAVQRALSGNAKLEFSYYRYDVHKKFIPRKNGEKYLVVPLHLVYSDAFYYLVAWSEKDSEIRNYRIDRMRDVVPCDAAEKNSEIEDFNITKYMQTTFSMYPGEKANLTLKVSNSAMSAFIDRFGEDVCVTKVVEEACSIGRRISCCGQCAKCCGQR